MMPPTNTPPDPTRPLVRPDWSLEIDPGLREELERYVLVTRWDKLLGMIDTVYNWSRRSSLWPLGFGLACCAIEMICTASSRFDIARFGAEVFRGSPRQADVMIVSGTVTKTMMPMIARLYEQMAEPKYVIAMGACATGGGPFKEGYNVVSGVDKFLPVDIYVPGCPPTPQALIHGLMILQKKIDGEQVDISLPGLGHVRPGNTPWNQPGVDRSVPIPVLGPDLIDPRLLEITAERTAQGLLDTHQADLPRPSKIPAPQPDPPVTATEPPEKTTTGKPSVLDRLRGKASTTEPADSAAVQPAPPAKKSSILDRVRNQAPANDPEPAPAVPTEPRKPSIADRIRAQSDGPQKSAEPVAESNKPSVADRIRAESQSQPSKESPAEVAEEPRKSSVLDRIRSQSKPDEATKPATPAPPPRPAARPTRKIKTAPIRPSQVWIGDVGLTELANRLNTALGAGSASILKAGLLIPPEKLRDVAFYLRDRNPIRFDYLASLQSVHYADCIEVNYHLESIQNPGSLIELRVRVDEAEGKGHLPSVVDLWPGADHQEREVFDMMGIRFDGHPNHRRILMWDGYAYYPLRKDFLEPYYEGPTKVFESRIEDGHGQHFRAEERNPHGTNVKVPREFQDWASLSADDDVKGRGLIPTGVQLDELGAEQYMVSMGPQHPSTHGVFRMNLRVDGETIVGLKPVMGYMHRNHEKIGERNTYLMNMPFTDRLDYLTSMTNNYAYALAVEQLMGDDARPPERAEYIRVIMAELTRIASHLWGIGFLLNDLGAFFTPALYAIEERELILDLFEWASGSRMMCNYFRFGGVAFDLPRGWLERCRAIVETRLDRKIDEIDRLLSANEIFLSRARGVGILTAADAIAYSTSGPVLRGSGVAYDLRRAAPYGIYDRFPFDVITGTVGDIYDRYSVRLREMRESVRILKQAVREIPEGPILPGRKSYQVKVPVGEAYSRSEAPKGELGFYIVSDGGPTAYRYHVRSPSFINLTALEQLCLGHTIADVVGILGSLDIILGEVDR